MAVPIDHSQNIRGIAEGLQSAMPGIQAAMPGDEITQSIIDDFLARRQRGEDKETSMSGALAAMQNRAATGGPAYPTPSTPDVGMNNGAPSLGAPGQIAPTPEMPSTPPNSFTGMTPQGLSNPSTQGQAPQAPQAPAPAPVPPTGGLQEAAALPPQGSPGGWGNPVSTPASSTGPVNINPTPAPAYTPTSPEAAMDMPTEQPRTAAPAKVSLMNRGQQDRAMGAIAQASTMGTRAGTLELKEKRLLLDTAEALIKSNRLSKKDVAELQLKMEGLDQKGQIEVMKMYIQMKQNEEKNGIARDRNKISANRRTNGADKMPPKLKQLYTQYQDNNNAVTKYDNSGFARKNPDELKRLKTLRLDAWNKYNRLAIELDWGETTMDGNDRPVPEDFRTPTGNGFNDESEE